MTKLSKIVLTGAAGNLGHVLRAPLSALCDSLASVDIVDLRTEALDNESFHKIDVAEMDLIAVLSNCPEELNDATGENGPTPIRVTLRRNQSF